MVVDPQNAFGEGGEIKLMNSNSTYNPWHIDNYAGKLRFFHSGTVYFESTSLGEVRVPYGIKINNALKVSSENNFVLEGSVQEDVWGDYMLTNNTTTRTLRLGVSNDGYTRGEIEVENNNSVSGKIFFKTTDSNTGAITRMTILGNGDVGIGTTDTKGFKLGVQGKIAAEEVKVAVHNKWSDFVFNKNYNLPTLKEEEEHIEEKGHLKDIPSAEEVKWFLFRRNGC